MEGDERKLRRGGTMRAQLSTPTFS